MHNRNFIFISIRRDHRKGVATSTRAGVIVICEQNPNSQRFLCFRKIELLSVGVTRKGQLLWRASNCADKRIRQ